MVTFFVIHLHSKMERRQQSKRGKQKTVTELRNKWRKNSLGKSAPGVKQSPCSADPLTFVLNLMFMNQISLNLICSMIHD